MCKYAHCLGGLSQSRKQAEQKNATPTWTDGRPWTLGTNEGKGDHNHHNRSFHIHITKTGRLVT